MDDRRLIGKRQALGGVSSPRTRLTALVASVVAHAAILSVLAYAVSAPVSAPKTWVLAYLVEPGAGGGKSAAATTPRRGARKPGKTPHAGAPPLVRRTRSIGHGHPASHGKPVRQPSVEVGHRGEEVISSRLPVSSEKTRPAASRDASGWSQSGELPGSGGGANQQGTGEFGSTGGSGRDDAGVTVAHADLRANPLPPYPSYSRRHDEQGTVMLRVLVRADGRVERVEIAKSSGFGSLDRAALETVRIRWRFIPASRGGLPVASWVMVPIRFRLKGSAFVD